MSGRDNKTKEEKPVAKEVKGKYGIAEIPTQTDFVIMNKDNNDETYTLLTAVCKIMNDIEELKKK